MDIGGTFTDLVAYDEQTGEIRKAKSHTVPSAPEEGVLRALDTGGIQRETISDFMHATTLVTNLILTRSGAKVGLITTRGFRDVLEIGRVFRNEFYNLAWDKPKHVVPRHLIKEVSERMNSKGDVVTSLNLDEVNEAVGELLAAGIEAIAVAFFNSYANPKHEQFVGQAIAELAPDMYVSLSSEVDPRIREYERVSTTVLNAYAMPQTHGYMRRLEESLHLAIKYMHSGGGIIPASVAEGHPIALAASGPAAGVLAAQFIGKRVEKGDLITMDVGGTSCDVCVLRDGNPEVKDSVEVSWGIPARTQAIDVNSIGAGGGSIAWVDEGGTLRVGPQSAGADPGPACYGLGGELPTATDANLVLGILSEDNFLGGTLKVSTERARQAINPIAKHFGVPIEDAAWGIHRLLNAHMAQAILTATVKKGIDPRDFALVPFGGAGGQTAVEVAQEVGIPQVLFPPNPSTFSAFGLLTADLKHTVSRTILMPIDRFDSQELENALAELRDDARQFLAGQDRLVSETNFQSLLDVRYIGQSTEVPVPFHSGVVDAQEVYREFERRHKVLYGTILGDAAEIVNIRVTATGVIRPIRFDSRPAAAGHDSKPTPKGQRSLSFLPAPIDVLDRETLEPGMRLNAPCIIEEVDSTLLIPSGAVRVDELRNILIEVTPNSQSGSPRETRSE